MIGVFTHPVRDVQTRGVPRDEALEAGAGPRYRGFVREVQAMMLAAGFGTRLWPLTADRGKPAVPFRGRPLVRGQLDWLRSHGIRDVVVNTHHQARSVEAALADAPEVRFSPESEILGTAGALGLARTTGRLDPERTTLIVNAKLVTDIDLSRAIFAHLASGAAVTMVLRTNEDRAPFTTVRVNEGRITGFGPSRVPEGPSPLMFTGIHLIEPQVLARAEPRFSDSVLDLYPPEIDAGRVHAHVDDDGRWLEASTLARYLSLEIEDGGWRDPSASVAPGATISNAAIGALATVEDGAEVESSALWRSSRVQSGARVRGSVLGEGVVVPAGATLEGVVAVRPELAGSAPPGAPPVRYQYGLALCPISPIDTLA